MANRKSKMTKQRNNTMQLEKLEARQLLATVNGGGEEVGTDIVFQGNTYDQILMTGASVTVEADPGQVVRVSAVDINDDIVQYEFSGAGRFSVSLDDFEGPADPVNYNQPGVQYVKGRASITIEGSNSSTNVSVSTVGEITSPVFGSLDNGADLDGVADIARITIVADPTQPGGSTFGGIRTANARYEDDSGIVGITAAGVNVQSVVIMGDVNASDTGVPTLLFGGASQFGTLQVAGGDLAQDNGAAINDLGLGGFQSVNFIDGTTSDNVLQPAGVFGGAFVVGGYAVATLDTTETIDITGLNQAEIDAIFLGKTFTTSVNVVGDLAIQNNITAAEFRQNVTFDGVYNGPINVGAAGVGGDMSFLGVATDPDDPGAGDRTISSNITIVGALDGSLNFGSATDTDAVNYSGIFAAPSTGADSINVWGDFSGTFTTDVVVANGAFNAGEGALGSINVTGDFSGNALGILGIGDTTVGGDLTGAGGGAIVFGTSSGAAGDSFLANMGMLTVDGDTNITDGGILINIGANGNFGDVNLNGGGTNVGTIVSGGILGGTTTGAINITGGAASGVTVHGIDLNAGTLGNFTVTGDGTTGTAFTLADTAVTGFQSTAGTFNLSDVMVSGFDTITLTDPIAPGAGSTAGNFSFDANGGAAGTAINSTGGITILDSAGTFTFTSETNTVAATGITVTNNSGAVTFNGNTNINGDFTSSTLGAFLIDGDAVFADDKGIVSDGNLASFEVTGDTTFDSTSGPNLLLGDAGDFTFGGDANFAGAGPAILGDDGTSGRDELGNFTFNGQTVGADGVTDVQASNLGDFTFSSSLTAANDALVLDFNAFATPNTDAGAGLGETVSKDGSNLSDYSIGNVTVQNTNVIGITGTTLFDTTTAGNGNSFIALGSIGNISLIAGGSENVQTSLFSADTDRALFIVGDQLGDPSAGLAGLKIDFEGDTAFDAYSSATSFTGGTFSIGNVLIDVASIDPNTDSDSVLFANGEPGAATSYTGLNILSGVTGSATGTNAIDDSGGNDDLAEADEIMVRNDALMAGTIGTVTIVNKAQQLSTSALQADITATVEVETTSDALSGIVAATDVGAVNGGADPAASKNAVVVGNAVTGGTALDVETGEFIVYIV